MAKRERRQHPDEAPSWLRGYVFFGASILIAALFLYTHNVAVRLERQSRASTRVLADFCATVTPQALEFEAVQPVFREVVQQIDFPVVLTDMQGRPWVWKGVGISMEDVTLEESQAFDPHEPDPQSALARILEISREMDKQNPPMAMVKPGTEGVMGYVHYGDSPLVRELRWVPFVEISAFVLFIGLGFLGFRSAKVAEQRYIWVGMAKETAHQLGTPISSLMGWIEMLSGQRDSQPNAEKVAIDSKFLGETVAEMSSDVERLNKVALRFSHVGSEPKRQVQPLLPIIQSTVEYIRRRAPHVGRGLEIEESYTDSPPVEINGQLVEWVVENLLKNALDATRADGGRISVTVFPHLDGEAVEVDITDNGRGIPPGEQRRIFAPGYSTKKRGWGLGLSLAKRIIEEYHGGRIWVKESRVGEGTTLAFSLPT